MREIGGIIELDVDVGAVGGVVVVIVVVVDVVVGNWVDGVGGLETPANVSPLALLTRYRPFRYFATTIKRYKP